MNIEQKSVFNLYLVFLSAIVMNFIPNSIVQGVGGLLLLVGVIMAYVYRARSKAESVQKTHMHYLIKSFWISSLLLGIGSIVAYTLADHSVINEMSDSIINGQTILPSQIEETMFTYLQDNIFIFAVTLLPSIFYLAYRVIRGMITVKKDKNISTTSWL